MKNATQSTNIDLEEEGRIVIHKIFYLRKIMSLLHEMICLLLKIAISGENSQNFRQRHETTQISTNKGLC